LTNTHPRWVNPGIRPGKPVPIICQCIPGHHPPFFDLLPFFFSLSPTILVPLSVIFARKFCLPESLFLDKNSNQSLFLDKKSNQIDWLILNLIIFILCDGSSIGWVAVAVADASSIGWVVVAVSVAAAVAVLAVQKIAMPLPFDGWWLRWQSKRGCTGIL
jgi:hypothetical protein